MPRCHTCATCTPVKSVAAFNQDLDFLLRHYRPLDLPTLVGLVQSGQRPAHNAVLLTFDDGLREFHDVVAPLLAARGVPAVCFLNSDFVDNRGLFYRYQASLLLEALAADPRRAQAPAVRAWQAAHAAPGQSLSAAVLAVSYQRRAVLAGLAAALEVDFGRYLREQQPYLTSAQVRALQTQGFHFGGHSCDHPEYQFLDLPEQLRQTRESVAAVAAAFRPDYQTFAFPFTDYGVSADFFRALYPSGSPGSALDLSFRLRWAKARALAAPRAAGAAGNPGPQRPATLFTPSTCIFCSKPCWARTPFAAPT